MSPLRYGGISSSGAAGGGEPPALTAPKESPGRRRANLLTSQKKIGGNAAQFSFSDLSNGLRTGGITAAGGPRIVDGVLGPVRPGAGAQPGGADGGGGDGYESDETANSAASSMGTAVQALDRTIASIDTNMSWDVKFHRVMGVMERLSKWLHQLTVMREAWADLAFESLDDESELAIDIDVITARREMHRGAAEAAEEGVSLDEFIESKQEWAKSKEKHVNERIMRLLKHVVGTTLQKGTTREMTQVSDKNFKLPRGLKSSEDPLVGDELGQSVRTLLHSYVEQSSHLIYVHERLYKDLGWRMDAVDGVEDDVDHPLHAYPYYLKIYRQQSSNFYGLLLSRNHDAVLLALQELRTAKVSSRGWDVSQGKENDGMSVIMRWMHQCFRHSAPEKERFETGLRFLWGRLDDTGPRIIKTLQDLVSTIWKMKLLQVRMTWGGSFLQKFQRALSKTPQAGRRAQAV